MEEIFMNVAKEGFCPDEIRPNINNKVDEIRKEYDRKFMETIRWFWEEVEKHTDIEEKKILFNQLSDCCKEEIIDTYNKINMN